MIAQELEKKGIKTVCVDEGVPDHPADYADYDFPDFETEREKILEKWRSFVKSADRETVYVFNCIFLQNPMCETMMHFGMDEKASEQYIGEIAEIIKPLSPVIVYIDQSNVKAAINAVLEERGNDWLNAVIGYHVSQGYGKQNGLAGYEGYIKCLEERRVREKNILAALDIESFVVCQDMTAGELEELFGSVGWSCPPMEQLESAIANSRKAFIVRHNGKPAAAVSLLGDVGMHWFVKDLIVKPEFQNRMMGTLLIRFCENYIKSTLKPNWKVCIDLRSSKGREHFYEKLGFEAMTAETSGCGMEKMIEK